MGDARAFRDAVLKLTLAIPGHDQQAAAYKAERIAAFFVAAMTKTHVASSAKTN